MSISSPSSYNDLIAELYAIPLDRHQRYRSDFVYRGLDISTYGLETSLQRLGLHYPIVEDPLLRSFIKYSVDRNLSAQTLLYKLAFAQHHGLPTRVLDWTSAPKIALHFAVGNEKHFDQDGIIWAVDVTNVRRMLPQALSNVLDHHRAFVFSVEMLPDVLTLADFDKIGNEAPFAMFFEPPSLDSRIVNQGAILSMMPGAELDLKQYLETNPSLVKKIIIRKELKWEIRDKLDQDSINERMLFPGEDGTARWLKRYYGSGSGTGAFTGVMTGTGT